DKHIEIIIRQMFKQILIISEGDSNLLPGSEVSIKEFKRINMHRNFHSELSPTKRPNFAFTDVSPEMAKFPSYFAHGTFPMKRPNES
ncbi:MAG: hypothetical protein Q8881_03240, partial [Sweet potato little leaf phytoplasma]|nr:hypothetical protein [Sweet potato little leaf phytoplasma]